MPSKPVKHKNIAPRLASGDKRLTIGHGLPPHVKAGLQHIAAHEHQSVSWVLEQIIIDYFGFDRPEYIMSERRLKDEFREAKNSRSTIRKQRKAPRIVKGSRVVSHQFGNTKTA